MKQPGQFKALSIDRKEWVTGDLVHFTPGAVSIMTEMKMIAVDNATVCQAIERADKRGNPIYMHDVLRYFNEDKTAYEDLEVIYNEERAALKLRNKAGQEIPCTNTHRLELVGNIFDNNAT